MHQCSFGPKTVGSHLKYDVSGTVTSFNQFIGILLSRYELITQAHFAALSYI